MLKKAALGAVATAFAISGLTVSAPSADAAVYKQAWVCKFVSNTDAGSGLGEVFSKINNVANKDYKIGDEFPDNQGHTLVVGFVGDGKTYQAKDCYALLAGSGEWNG